MVAITALAIYPVKGLRGIPLQSARLERCGLEHDRRWAVLRPDGRVLTQRDLPMMARIDAFPEQGALRLEATGRGGVEARADGPPCALTVWGTRVPAVSASQDASDWLARVLGTACALAYLADPAARPVTPDLARPGDVVNLADGFPLLVANAASLDALNACLAEPAPMERFRPNLVVSGAPAWAEDGWSHLDVPRRGVRLRLASPCSRCAVITLDQRTGDATPRREPFRALGRMRRDAEGHVTFGWNAIPEALGELRVGDEVGLALRPGACAPGGAKGGERPIS